MGIRFNSRYLASMLMVAASILAFATLSRGQGPPEVPARVQLIWDGNPIRPGHRLWVGVLFRLSPGWHIYWQNPGDSGEPPKIQWKLPPDFHGDEILWPRPILLGKGSVRDYGYEGDILLLTPLQTPANLPATAPVAFAATVKYVVCREVCIPDKANVTLSVPLYGQPNTNPSPWRELFKLTRDQVPNPLPPDWKASAVSTGENFVLSLEGAGAVQQAVFFPLDPGVIENSAPQTVASEEKATHLTLKKSQQLAKPISTLRGVLVLDGTRAYDISVPVGSM